MTTQSHPMFAGAITASGIRVGLTFLVWDIATGKVVEAGLIVTARFVGSEDREPEVRYVDRGGGRAKEFDLKEFGVIPKDGANSWSHKITLPGEYATRLDELPRIPNVAS
jgi:hypothetical protein